MRKLLSDFVGIDTRLQARRLRSGVATPRKDLRRVAAGRRSTSQARRGSRPTRRAVGGGRLSHASSHQLGTVRGIVVGIDCNSYGRHLEPYRCTYGLFGNVKAVT